MPAEPFHHHALSPSRKPERRRADGGARADVGGEERREDQARPEPRPATKKSLALRAAADPQAERDEQSAAYRDEECERDASTTCRSRAAG